MQSDPYVLLIVTTAMHVFQPKILNDQYDHDTLKTIILTFIKFCCMILENNIFKTVASIIILCNSTIFQFFLHLCSIFSNIGLLALPGFAKKKKQWNSIKT